MKTKTILTAIIIMASLLACEKPVIEEATGNDDPESANVILRFVRYDKEDFDTRSATDVTNVCSRLNLALFSADGTKVKTIAQKKGDTNYGTVTLAISPGTYKLVVIAHNGDGTATITAEDKVTFPNNKVTDTFYYYGTLEVSTEQKTHELVLTRAVAMFRLILTDSQIPSSVSKFKFYYLGGSSTFSPLAGYGCVNSKQTEIRTVSNDGIYELYTLPHAEEDVLTKMTITALDASDNELYETVLENIPVTRNQITKYTTNFFNGWTGDNGEVKESSGDFSIMVDPEWAAEIEYR